jgi:hypothetical protein
MQQWRTISMAIGGVVAVGFMDEDRVIVGSHSGYGGMSGALRRADRCWPRL